MASRGFQAFAKVATAAGRVVKHFGSMCPLVKAGRVAIDLTPNLRKWRAMATGAPLALEQRKDIGGVPCTNVGGEGDMAGTILYLHGGGYVVGSTALSASLATALHEETSRRVVNVEYRLAPEHPLPAAVDDVVSVFKGLVDNSGLDPSTVALVGDSAGGGLVLLALQRMRDDGVAMPGCAVVISPWTDLACTSKSHAENTANDPVLGGQPIASFAEVAGMAVGNISIAGDVTDKFDPASPTFSPLYGSFDGLPPLLFMVGATEVLLDDSLRAHKKAVSASVDATLDIRDTMCHSLPLFTPLFPEADKAASEIAEFIATKCKTVSKA